MWGEDVFLLLLKSILLTADRTKIFSAAMLTLLLVGILILGLKVQPVKAVTITVPDDYSTIQAAINAANSGDTVFVKAGTYNGKVVVNKTISLIGENRANTFINESKEIGDVVIIAANGVLISNFTVNGFKEPNTTPPPDYWVYMNGIINEGYNDTTIVNIGLNGGNELGIDISNANNITIRDSSIIGNIHGVYLYNCSNIALINNIFRDNWGYSHWFGKSTREGYGLRIDYCYNATLKGNTLQNNADDFAIDGDELGHFLHDIDTSNLLINGATRKMYYLINRHHERINFTGYPELGFLALVNSTGIDVRGFELVDNTPGLLLAYTNNSVVTNNTMSYCTWGISLVNAHNNTIFENTFAPNNTNSIRVKYFSTNNTIARNSIIDNTGLAMQITNSSQTIIANNNVTNNPSGGIFLEYSDNNKLIGNNIENNGEWNGGIYMSYSCNNTLRNNTMRNNSVNFRVVAYFDTNLFHFTHDIDPSNLVDGKHIYYLINHHDETIDPSTYPDAGFLALVNSTGITAKDLTLQGMLLGYTTSSQIQNNTLIDCAESITLVKSSSNNIAKNNVRDSEGISLYDRSNNNTITGNNVTKVYYAISLSCCENNTVSNNRVTENFMGINVERSNNTVITGNYAVNNSCGIHVSLGNFGTVTGNNATNNSEYGIWLAISLNNTVIDNYVAGNRAGGIRVDNASNNTISGNKIKDNSNAGISCRYGSHNNTIVGNDISNSTRCGIEFYLLQTQNTIIGNNITDSGEDGISMLWSALNIISSNNITNSTRDGIHVEGFLYLGEDPEDTIVFGSMNNSITWNNVMFSGRYAIYMEAYNNTIHHNRFVGYTAPTFSDAAYPNIWDDGYPSGGNYWSDFKERYPHVEDVYSGEYPQSVPGSDGFWDSPYEINENNIDHYPIVPEFPSSIVLPIFMVLTIAAVVFRKKKTTRTKA